MQVEELGVRRGEKTQKTQQEKGSSYVGYARDTLTLELTCVELLDSCSEVGGALELNKTRARQG